MYWNRRQKRRLSTGSAPIRRKGRRPGGTDFVVGDVGRRGLVALLDWLPREDHVDGAGVHQPGDVSVRTHWRRSAAGVSRLEMRPNAARAPPPLTIDDVSGAPNVDRRHLLFPQLRAHTHTHK